MPKLTTINHNFTAGEITPKMWGRIDVQRYAAGAELIENAWPLVHGGVEKRWGTTFVGEAKHHDKTARLIPFIVSRDQAFVLEVGKNYIRFHTDDGTILSAPSMPYEVATTYTEAMLAAIDYTQGADTMISWHPSVFPKRLRRFADDNWLLDDVPLDPVPFDETGDRPAATITLSAATVGTGRTVTAGASVFLDSDVGRSIWAGTGVATITAYTSGTQVTATISAAFNATSYTATNWVLTGSPQSTCTPSDDGPIGAAITLTLGSTTVGTPQTITGIAWLAGTVTVNLVGHGYTAGATIVIAGNSPAGYNGTFTIAVPDPDSFTYALASDPGASTLLGTAASTTSSTVNGWRSGDVGKYVSINDGLCRITQVTSATVAQAVVMRELNTVVASIPNAWALNGPAWNSYDGYPSTGTFHDQRLFAAGTASYPQTVWGSAIGLYYDFMLGTDDDQALAFSLVSDDVNTITFLSSMDALVALTYGGEFTIEGGVEKPIAPTNVKAKPRSNHGCRQVRPVRVGREELFVQRSGKRVRGVAYDEDSGRWQTPDMSVLADHIISDMVAMTWHQDPNGLVFAARSDGVMPTCTLDRDQDVVGWARQVTDGVVESMATIPAGDGDRTFILVRRTIDGVTKRYIEKFDPAMYVDSGITGTHPTGTKVWTGLDHLEGKEVAIRADGVTQSRQTVASGQITLARNAKAVQIGIPFKMRVKLLRPELTGGSGQAQASPMRTHSAHIMVLDTIGLTVNGEAVAFRSLGDGVLDEAIEPFTGIKPVHQLGWDRGDSEMLIEHDDPTPCHVLSVIRKMTFNEG